MKPITQEWVNKAENNFAVAQLLTEQSMAQYDIICFHAQQCAEMYLKACLQEADIFFPKTHELSKLLDLLLSTESNWESIRPTVQSLTSYAVEYRYPGSTASEARAQKALEGCCQIRQFAQQHLEPDPPEATS